VAKYMPVVVDQTERRPSWEASNTGRIRNEYDLRYVFTSNRNATIGNKGDRNDGIFMS
jgi:hypothetical protein